MQEAQAEKLDAVPMILIEQIKSPSQALALSVSLSSGTHESLANEIGKPRETLTRFLNGNGGLNFTKLISLINATGNLVLLQYIAYLFGYKLKALDNKAKRIAELEAEMKELRA